MRTSAAACIIDLSNPFWTYYLIQSSAGKKKKKLSFQHNLQRAIWCLPVVAL